MKNFWILAVVMCCFSSAAQRREIGITLENDLFTSSVSDKYYTNGIEFFFRKLDGDSTASATKKTSEIRIGQHIFNPQTVKAENPNVHDRPFAGYLFGRYAKSWFYRNKSVLKTGATVGLIGPSALGEETQRGLHSLLGYKEVKGWEYQICDLYVFQADVFYSRQLLNSKNADLHWNGSATFGTAFSHFKMNFTSRIALLPLLDIDESALYGASVNGNAEIKVREFYFYISPGYQYQQRDASIEGKGKNDESPITFPLVHHRFQGKAGFVYRKESLLLSYSFVYQTREVVNRVNSGHFFGSISASWLF